MMTPPKSAAARRRPPVTAGRAGGASTAPSRGAARQPLPRTILGNGRPASTALVLAPHRVTSYIRKVARLPGIPNRVWDSGGPAQRPGAESDLRLEHYGSRQDRKGTSSDKWPSEIECMDNSEVIIAGVIPVLTNLLVIHAAEKNIGSTRLERCYVQQCEK